jgi:hypothetical protein
MVKPPRSAVGDDVASFFTRKGYYAYALQAFVDSRCKFLSIASLLCASSHDATAYVMTALAHAIKNNQLPSQYHIVLDDAYTCTDQELTPWKGRSLSPDKDSFNYHLSLHRQVVERAFGLLIQRWGIFWRPLRVEMKFIPILIRVACKLHNICIDRFGENHRVIPYVGPTETDIQPGDNAVELNTDGVINDHGNGRSTTRQRLTEKLHVLGVFRPPHSKFSKVIRI